MARYFFNVHDGRNITDEVGSDLPDIAALKREAIRTATELLHATDDADIWDGEEWKLVVINEGGSEVLSLRLVGAISSS